MSERIYLQEMRPSRERFWWRTMDGREVSCPYDGNLGHLVAGVSSMAKRLVGLPAETEALTSETELDEFVIEGLTVEPYRFKVILTSGRYQFTANLDRDLEHILAAFSAAMRFFALKRGLVIVEDEVTRNAERAREQGLWTAPDGTA